MDSEENPLEFITTAQMIDELERRTTGLLIASMGDHVEGTDIYNVEYRGSIGTCIGLARIASLRLEAKFMDCEIEGDEDDE
jgi:hypothetical protein